MFLFAGRLWAAISPAIVTEIVSEGGSDAILWDGLVMRCIIGIVFVVIFTLGTAWAHRWSVAKTALLMAGLFAMCALGAYVFPAYSGKDGIDYIGQMIVGTLLHVYGGYLLATLVYCIIMLVACLRSRT
jgi:hypothetical protein